MERHGTDNTTDRTLIPSESSSKAVRDPQRPLGLNDIATETPEDVAILYSWANVPGAKYRDFSATRREYRAQLRRNAAEPHDAAESSPIAETAATPAPTSVSPITPSFVPPSEPLPSEHASTEHPPTPSSFVALQANPEVVVTIEPQPAIEPLSPQHAHASADSFAPAPPVSEYIATPPVRPVDEITLFRALAMHADSLDRQREQDLDSTPEPEQNASQATSASPAQTQPSDAPLPHRHSTPAPTYRPPTYQPPPAPVDIPDGPAWLYSPQEPFQHRPRPVVAQAATRLADTLQSSKERVAARWYALKGVFQQNPPNLTYEGRELPRDGNRPPILAVFSLAGGVGKTSLVATLGRSLSAMGERVLLADTTTHGLLPYYFGASDVQPGVLRTFWPPPGCKDAALQLVNYDVDRRSELQSREERKSEDSASQDKLLQDLTRNSRGSHRILLDLAATSSWVVRRVARMNPTILLPIAADMNSVITLRSVTRFFQSILDSEGKPLQPYFVLNQFDNKLPLHLDVREVLVQQLGDRLLPFVLHRSPAMSEALAEGMTIVDYDPDSIMVQDYIQLANWIRTVSAPVAGGFGNIRWSEK